MRRALVICLAAALSACGSDDDDNTPAPVANVSVSGGSDTFTGNNAIGYSTPTPLTCTFEGVDVSTSVLAVFVTDTGGDACALLNANQERKGMGGISIFIGRGGLAGAPAPIGPGTYQIDSNPVVDPVTQTATLVQAFEFKHAAGTCGGVSREADSGSVTINSVSGGVITGSINAQIEQADGGGTITGTFTTAACAVATPSCDAIIDDSPPVCVD